MPRASNRRAGEPRVEARGSLGGGPSAGYSLVELLVVVAIVVALLIAAIPTLDRAADTADAAAAARYLAAVVARARLDAVRRQRTVAVRFSTGTPRVFSVVVDGDGDGVNAADIASGTDRITRADDRIEDHFPRARLGIGGPVTGIDGGSALTAGDDPVRFGAGDTISLTAMGTATSGTAYLTSRAGVQFAVRLSGITGRTRVLRYDHGQASWRSY